MRADGNLGRAANASRDAFNGDDHGSDHHDHGNDDNQGFGVTAVYEVPAASATAPSADGGISIDSGAALGMGTMVAPKPSAR